MTGSVKQDENFLLLQTGRFKKLSGHLVRITDTQGTTVFESKLENEEYRMKLPGQLQTRKLFIQVLDHQGNIIYIRKILPRSGLYIM